MKKAYLIISLLLVGFTSLAQEKPGVKVIAKSTKSTIQLRWAPNNPSVWQLALKYGYTIERVTIVENGKVLKDPERKILNETPIMPADEKAWSIQMDKDDYVAVAAQAIFGETFEITESFSSDFTQVLKKTKELDQRYSFALFSADQSLEAAKLSGLFFEDEYISPDTRYLYRVYTNIPRSTVELDTGFVFLSMEDYIDLPQPEDVQVQFGDRSAFITWDKQITEKIYSSFIVERSDDNKNFKWIVQRPLVNTYQDDNQSNNRMVKVDSLPSNDKLYYYRVRGIDSFGEMGPPSDVISGSGAPLFAFKPNIKNHTISDEGVVELFWEFPDEGQALLSYFTLKKYYPKLNTYETIEENINKTSRSIKDAKANASNYYIISASDKYGSNNESFPHLVQLEDSIAPVRPKALIGKIDTTGLVFLEWNPNTESDLYGYRLFKSNFQSHEFIQVPGPIIKGTGYVDTIAIDNLTETIFYKLQAVDYRYNPSDFSEVLSLKKPDIIPPGSPVFADIKGDSLGVLVRWHPSSSSDVMEHVLYRRAQDEKQWKVVQVIPKTQSLNYFLDKNVEHRKAYAYTIIAVDDAQLESSPANPVSLKWINPLPFPAVKNIYHLLDRDNRKIKISWNYNQSNISQFQIYKASDEGVLKLINTVPADQFEFTDQYLIRNTKLQYKIVAIYNGGEQSSFGTGITIEL